MPLTISETALITQVLGAGMGAASSDLSRLVSEDVGIEVRRLERLAPDELPARLPWAPDQNLCGIQEGFRGPFAGNAVLFFPEERSRGIVRRLLGNSHGLQQMSEMEQETMREVGNVILNAGLAAIADFLGAEIATYLPVYRHGSLEDLLRSELVSGEGDGLLLIELQFSRAVEGHSGYLALMMDGESGKAFEDGLKSCIE